MARTKKVPSKKSRSAVAAPAPQSALLVDIRTAAGLLSATVWAVRQLLWGKKLPFIKIGRRFLIDPEDLRQFIAKQKGQMAQP